jgi:hypothetical protein
MESGIGQFIPLIVIITIVVVVLKLKNKGRETRIKEFNKKHGTNFKNELELNYFIATKLDKKAEEINPEKKEIVENDKEEDKSLTDKISRLKRLYNNGTLTKAEFEEAKNKLLK